MIRLIFPTCALAIFAGGALAQTTPTAPVGPTKLECDQGYKGGPWTQAQFTAACDKLRQGQGQ